MKPVSIFNDVLGPVMHGPSSSHTAAPVHIGAIATALLGDNPAEAKFTFDPGGSFAQVYAQQGSHLAFAAGVMGWSMTEEPFSQALDLAAAQGLQISFAVEPLAGADHPNSVEIQMTSRSGRSLEAMAKSIGGGAVVFTELDGWPVHLTGDAFEVLVEAHISAAPAVERVLLSYEQLQTPLAHRSVDERVLFHARCSSRLDRAGQAALDRIPGVRRVWTAPPVFFILRGKPLFTSGTEMIAFAEKRGSSLGQAALAYESELLGMDEQSVLAEMLRRLEVMRAAAERGLGKGVPPMQTLEPSARGIFQAEATGKLAIGGIHTRAAARAMAIMHINGGMGVVCAAPTAGAAGALPAVVVTLAEEQNLSPTDAAMALFAASGVGLVLATRATFAAEIAGCQVEIGAAGAMAAAAVVEAVGGSARQAADAAAIGFQNTMGSICDPVQGIVEIPCHTRNAVAASSAFVCADLVLGGYTNPIPLDETIDAVYAVGRMLPRELKCTALGGLSITPSALAMSPQR